MFQNHPNDALAISGDLHSVILENDRVRVLNVTVPPHATATMHWHPDNIVYVISDGTLRLTKEDGSSAEVALRAGDVKDNKAGLHAVENIGETELKVIQIEFKHN